LGHDCAIAKNAAGCLAPQDIKAGETLRVTVDSRITMAADSILSYSVRLDPAFRDRALIVVSPAAADVPVHFDARDEAGQRAYGVLHQAQVIVAEPRYPPSAVPSIALSTLPSWRALAQLHRQREDSLLDAEPKLPVFAGLSKREVVAQALRWLHARVRYDHDRFRDGAVFPEQSVSALLDSGMADCKGIALLFRAVMKTNGIDVQTVAVSTLGLRPVSWLIPGAWSDHVISYVPDLDLYLDAGIPLAIQNKSQGQERFRYEMGLNLATGEFGVIR
jgi:transglutaminase-like putative cysteine protease